MSKVAYLECTGDVWTDVALTLKHENGFTPVYWSAAESFRAAVQAAFPDAAFHQNASAVKGQLPDWLDEKELPAIGEDTLAALAYAETIAVRMMDRMDVDRTFDYVDRTRLFRRHLAIGLAIIEKTRPELVVCSSPPHLIYDYAFYMLCQHLGIETVVFVETAVDGLILSAPRFETASEGVGQAYRELVASGAPAKLSASSEAYLGKIRSNYDKAIPGYVVTLHGYQPTGPQAGRSRAELDRALTVLAARLAENVSAHHQAQASAGQTLASPRSYKGAIRERYEDLLHGTEKRISALRSRKAAKERVAESLIELADMLAATGRGNPDALADAIDCTRHLYQAIEAEYPLLFRSRESLGPTYLRQSGVDPWHSDISYIEYWLYRSLALRKKRALLQSYEKVAREADLAAPFIYAPLHYQPEASTQPLAGYYADQEMAIELLSRLLPDGWFIYIKEHPFQVDKKGSGELCRQADIYERLVRLPNVRIVSFETSPFMLIDRAKAVATATGTSGWEALCRGVPVLVYGHSWYRECEGAFDARTVADCKRAIEAIAAGYRVNSERVRHFMQAIETVGFRGYTISDLAADSGVPVTGNANGFVAQLRDRRQARPGNGNTASAPTRRVVS